MLTLGSPSKAGSSSSQRSNALALNDAQPAPRAVSVQVCGAVPPSPPARSEPSAQVLMIQDTSPRKPEVLQKKKKSPSLQEHGAIHRTDVYCRKCKDAGQFFEDDKGCFWCMCEPDEGQTADKPYVRPDETIVWGHKFARYDGNADNAIPFLKKGMGECLSIFGAKQTHKLACFLLGVAQKK